jgi:hypothetical protein
MANKYNKPWTVEYEKVYGLKDGKYQELDQPVLDEKGKKIVWGIVDCNGDKVVETDSGYYSPDADIAEYIVKCVNEREEDIDEDEFPFAAI